MIYLLSPSNSKALHLYGLPSRLAHVRDDILWIKNYIEGIDFCSMNDSFPGKEYYGQDITIISPQFVYLGIMRSHLWGIPGLGDTRLMSSKYAVLNLQITRSGQRVLLSNVTKKEKNNCTTWF